MSQADDFLHFPQADDHVAPNCTAHTEGYRAFMADRLLVDNPYKLGTPENSMWATGWLECSAEQGESSD